MLFNVCAFINIVCIRSALMGLSFCTWVIDYVFYQFFRLSTSHAVNFELYAEQTTYNCFRRFCFVHGFEYFRFFHYCWFSTNKYVRYAWTKYNWRLGIPYCFLNKWHIIKCTMDWDQTPINNSLFDCSHFTGENGETN